MITFETLAIGTVVSYTDFSNPTREAVVLDTEVNQWGTWVNLLWKDDNSKENVTAHTTIGDKSYVGWQIVKA